MMGDAGALIDGAPWPVIILVALIGGAVAIAVALIKGRNEQRGGTQAIIAHLAWQDQQIVWLQGQMPPGGLTQWIEVTRKNTEVLTELTGAINGLRETDAQHEQRIAAIEAAHRPD